MPSLGTLGGGNRLRPTPAGSPNNINNAPTAISGYAGLSRVVVADERQVIGSLALIELGSGKAGAATETPLTLTRGLEKPRVLLNLASIMESLSALSRHFLPLLVDAESDRQLDRNIWVKADPRQLHHLFMDLRFGSCSRLPRRCFRHQPSERKSSHDE